MCVSVFWVSGFTALVSHKLVEFVLGGSGGHIEKRAQRVGDTAGICTRTAGGLCVGGCVRRPCAPGMDDRPWSASRGLFWKGGRVSGGAIGAPTLGNA